MGRYNLDLLDIEAKMTWLTPSKKKNLLTVKVLMSMTKEAATTDRRAIILQTRIPLRMMWPGPARLRLKKGIFAGEGGNSGILLICFADPE